MKKSLRLLLGSAFCAGVLVFFFSLVSYKPEDPIRFIEDTSLRRFDQLRSLPQFKGKVVYVDVWGTRCIPCIEEFAFCPALKDTFQKKPVEYLYVAVDYGYADDRERWKTMAKERNLTGYHVLASKELYLDIWENVKGSVKDMYLIPHYVILDKEGNIAYPNARRPSGQGKLYRQLRAVLAK